MKHNKLVATLVAAGSLVAMTGAAHAISPAAALGLAAIGGAAVGSAAAEANNPPAVAVVPASPTVVLGGPPATTTITEVTPAPREGYTWVPGHWEANGSTTGVINHDHDADGVLNSNDRYPNDPGRS